ncbi:MAG: Cell envelope-related transcriptional attenuator [Candidatus Yanofskybacteria bacterium GW2011_GWA1_48_10]|uniref:Cell envelope-related transcriptional attenuator n=2 Tax=Candidatus Yanofskyibacteriota TaxID=1752733 RepID=A0A0G1X711_9BACT|nr:MAG: Cell envelope-related transcriptional attenuator [Candidatus Yanofskybacteria bacterium GW2011_GWA1_48_10]OGN06600.1 MAG: hypothetical protein A2669_03075 [Candidatus Yanofskybacteria bacterium RIFCSPHIGHO2_01_FULL_48_25b]
MEDNQIPTLAEENIPSSPKRKKGGLIIIGILLAATLFYIGGMSRQISIANIFGPKTTATPAPDSDYIMPKKESDRLDVLILGIRGEDDVNAANGGPLLTDSIQIVSYDKRTGETSLVSLPRDLYVEVDNGKNDKLNAVYEYGISHSSNSLNFIKEKISQITGVYIDQVVVFDFASFKEIIDALGGIDLTLAAPFTENQQWGYKFSLPAGKNHLDGQSALYYARSRYSSSDFDRSRRQQQIIMAIKDKLLQLNFVGDPVKSFSVLNMVRNNIKTDIGVWNIGQYLDMAGRSSLDAMKRTVISTDNLLIESKENGLYVLLPKSGDLSEIKRLFSESLN